MADQYRDRPFQTDQDDGRDDHDRDDNHALRRRPAESDPLAELARLIGQTDPFSTFGRDNQQAPPRRDEHGADDAASYDDEEVSQPSWMRNRPPGADAAYGADPYEQDDDARYETIKRNYYDENPGFDPPAPDRNAARYDDVLFGQPDRDQHAEAPFSAARERYADDPFEKPHFDDDADEAQPRRRGGTMTVVVVLLLAVVGTAAAFGYRTFIGSPRSGEPPVIKADAGPNKVMSAATGDGKQINDRIGDKTGERIVSREEQPVDVNGKAQPRVVFPPLAQNSNPPNPSSANTASRPTGAGVGNGTVNGEEPRKIRTLTIRPDQPDTTPTAATSPQPAPTPRAPSNSASAAAPAGGPIALTPQPRAPAAETRSRVAAITSPPSNGGGSYVQVSSQKTEADAQSSFRAIQSKYSEVLASKPSTIRRADLGDKGVFYRALVGPFGTTDEATQFCVNLKAAGGQCIVQRN